MNYFFLKNITRTFFSPYFYGAKHRTMCKRTRVMRNNVVVLLRGAKLSPAAAGSCAVHSAVFLRASECTANARNLKIHFWLVNRNTDNGNELPLLMSTVRRTVAGPRPRSNFTDRFMQQCTIKLFIDTISLVIEQFKIIVCAIQNYITCTRGTYALILICKILIKILKV